MKKLALSATLVVASLTTGILGCGGEAPGSSTVGASATAESGPRDVAQIHRSRCGSCHERVERGARSRDAFEAALARHHQRVKMTDTEWRMMIDYLAADGRTASSTK